MVVTYKMENSMVVTKFIEQNEYMVVTKKKEEENVVMTKFIEKRKFGL